MVRTRPIDEVFKSGNLDQMYGVDEEGKTTREPTDEVFAPDREVMEGLVEQAEASVEAAGEQATAASGSATEASASADAADVARIAAEAAALEAQTSVANPSVAYDTRAELYADLAHAAGTVGQVLDDGSLNGFYVKSGASGSGSWVKKSNATIPGLDANKADKTALEQVADNVGWSLVSSGGGPIIDGDGASYAGFREGTPLTAYVDGQEFTFVPPVTSTIASPPLTIDGLADLSLRTSGGGLLQPGDIVSARVYRVRLYGITAGSPTARVVQGQLGGDRQPLTNLFANGQLDPNGDFTWYGSLLSSNTSYSITPVAASTTLRARGIIQMIEFPVATEGASQTGWYEDVNLDRGSVLGMVSVELVSGDWDGVTARMRLIFDDGTNATANLTSFLELSSTERLYYDRAAISSGKICTRVEVYVESTLPRTSAYNAGGFWASWLKQGGSSIWSDTAWHDWGASASRPRPPRPVVKKDNFQLLREELGNPLWSPTLCFAGDSNTWGGVATGITANSPRAQQLSDVRNLNFDPVACPTWFNQVADFLIRSFNAGTITTGGAGPERDPDGAWISSRCLVQLNPARDTQIRYVSRWTGSQFPKPAPVAENNAYHDEYLQLTVASNTALEFDFCGDDLRIMYSRNTSTPGALELSYTIDGGEVQTINLDGSIAFGQVAQIDTDFGEHTIRLWPSGSSAFLRFESIGHNRRLLCRSQGIYGSNIDQWQKSANRLYPGIRPEDKNVFFWMSTNLGDNPTSAILKRSFSTFCGDIISDGHRLFLTTSCPEYGGGDPYDTWEKSLIQRQVARELDIPLIDHFAAFMALPELTIRSAVQRNAVDYIGTDNTHLTDLGHRIVRRDWVRATGLSLVDDQDADVKDLKAQVAAFRQSGFSNAVTGTTAETDLSNTTIPGGTLRNNDSIKITALFTYTNSANEKRISVKFGGTAFTIFNATTSNSARIETVIWMAGSTTSQVGAGSPNPGTGPTTAFVSGSADTSLDQLVTITGKLALTSETITMRGITIEIIRGQQ